jgi:hypothetical protein
VASTEISGSIIRLNVLGKSKKYNSDTHNIYLIQSLFSEVVYVATTKKS